jgi:hypothetical protein
MYISIPFLIVLILAWVFREWISRVCFGILNLLGLAVFYPTAKALDHLNRHLENKAHQKTVAAEQFRTRDKSRDFKGLSTPNLILFGGGFALVTLIGYLAHV